MTDNTPWVQDLHTNQTDTPQSKGRYIALDNIAGYLCWAVSTDPRITELLQSSKQAGRMLQRVVLGSLAVHTNDQGIARVSQERISKDIGVDRRDVRNALKQLKDTGLISAIGAAGKGKTQGYLVLPFVVSEKQKQLEETIQHGGQVGGQVGGQHGGQHGGQSRHKVEIEIETPLQQKPERKRQGASKGGNDSLVKLCIERDLEKHPTQLGAGLRQKMTKQYRELMNTAREKHPKASDAALVTWCVNQRWGVEPTTELRKELDPDRYSCDTCKGSLSVPGKAYRDEQDNWVNPGMKPCPTCQVPDNVTQLDTLKRVNEPETANTYLPGGTAQAYAQSLAGQLTRHMKAN